MARGSAALSRRLFASVALLLALWSSLVPAALAAARVNEADLENEVMCVQCGRPLSTSSGSAADQERALIQGWIEQGLTKAQIKQQLVAEYGERALVDDQSPVAAAAPWIAAIAGALSIGFLLYRRRQRDAPSPGHEVAAGADASTPGSVNGAASATGISASADSAPAHPTGSQLSAADEARIDAELAERG